MDWREKYRGKKVLITGHSGFKGSWMTEVLHFLGAEVYGYSLAPPTSPSLYGILDLQEKLQNRECIADIRDGKLLQDFLQLCKPEIVIHMAAQPIVRTSYEKPVETFETNVMGTVNILEAVRNCPSVRSVVNVTTDKVYRNVEKEEGYTEGEFLCGYDPYSNSKSCSELVTYSYVNSFFDNNSGLDKALISTMRAGNVIGGGDFAKDRLIPDCVRAVEEGLPIVLRNPASVRPFQHVLEPVCAYLQLAVRQIDESELAGSYNVGPAMTDCLSAQQMAECFCEEWNRSAALISGLKEAGIECRADGGPHEAGILKLDCSLIKNRLGWAPRWDSREAVKKVVEWTAAYLTGAGMDEMCMTQIRDYFRFKDT